MSLLGLSKQEWMHVLSTLILILLGKFYMDHISDSIRMLNNNSRPGSSERSDFNVSGSSVWCMGSNHTHRMCRFKNLCYSAQQQSFLFFHSNTSKTQGLPRDRFNPTLTDFSSVRDHSAKYFNYVDLPVKALEKFSVNFIEETSLILSRFHPDNIMHVFHDDLIPIWYTTKMMTTFFKTFQDIQLVFMDNNEDSEFWNLYEILSTRSPMLQKSVAQSDYDITCFSDAFVGLSKSTIWYDYGFKEPQHSLQETKLTPSLLKDFTDFALTGLSLPRNCDENSNYIVLITRKFNRLIVNEIELTFHLMRELSMKVLTVGLETHSVGEIIEIISCAKVMVGMHGSLLILAMFLPPNSIILELFPYAVNPSHYTPYRTLVEKGLDDVTYLTWRNFDIQTTVTHPDDDPETGGIEHLSKSEQLKILASEEVPLHLCCVDPEWLFRIYQDTVIDVEDISKLIKSGLSNPSTKEKAFESSMIYPSSVNDIKCTMVEGTRNLDISWTQPWNLQFFGKNYKIRYEIMLQENAGDYKAYLTSKTTLSLEVNCEACIIWVKCTLNERNAGPFNKTPVQCNK